MVTPRESGKALQKSRNTALHHYGVSGEAMSGEVKIVCGGGQEEFQAS